MSKAENLARKADNNLSDRIKERFDRKQRELRDVHDSKVTRHRTVSGSVLAKMRSEIIDKVICQILTHGGYKDLKNVAVVALGGYGRNEQCPYSDVDLMFLYKPRNKKIAKDVTEKLVYVLWDLKLDLGYSVRTIDECMELSVEDEETTILTSLLDSRFVYGDKELYDELDKRLFNDLLPGYSSKFIQLKIAENEERLTRFGRSVYLLEPNVKEGEGGIRDINYALWIAQAKYKVRSLAELLPKGILIERELRTFEKGLNFLLSVRSELHYLAERPEDCLGFEYQEKIAAFLGFKDADLPAVERFMRIYYLRATDIREQSRRLIDRCADEPKPQIKSPKKINLEHGFIILSDMLSVGSPDIFNEDPANLMRAFEYSDKHNVRMSTYLLDLIRNHVSVTTIDEEVRSNPEFNASFLRLLVKGEHVADALFLMNRLKLLGYFIPEFGKIVCMVQHDAYHVYTVDIHSIMMVREIENLLEYKYYDELPLLTKTAESLVSRHVLYLACLFHDMGKGEGRNHAQKGAAMIPRIAKRMGLNQEESGQLEFLVKHHLVMSHFSQRRDIHDYSLIVRFAKSVKSLETLSLLYLLTFADIKTVGPEVWTNWKAMLLKELFIRTAKVLEQGEFYKVKPGSRKKRVIKDVIQILDGEVSSKNIRKRLKDMPDSYFMGFSPRTISCHIQLIEKSKDGFGMDVLYYPTEQYNEFTFWGFDEPGIFSKLCGVIRASGLNVLGARITTRKDGRILDVFYVNRMGKMVAEDDPIWKKLGKNMRDVLLSKTDVEKLVAKKKMDKPRYGKTVPQYPSKIEVDNESSDKATIIDIYTYDRAGLLFDITKTIRNLELSIEYAKISTKVDQVVDAFYVVDTDGNKVTDSEAIDRIKADLFEVVAKV